MIDYPIEEALERIAETVEEFKLDKPPKEMDEAELFAAEYASTKYVEWVDDEEYIQLVPKVKKTGRILYPA